MGRCDSIFDCAVIYSLATLSRHLERKKGGFDFALSFYYLNLPHNMLDVGEKILDLPDGRILAYSDIGEPSSSCLVIFFHGVFNVGSATRLGKVLSDRHVRCPDAFWLGEILPLRDKSVLYDVALAADITALIEHLHPGDPALKIYLTGGSYGTVPAQILYGAPFDIFPFGDRVMGCMVLGLISPCDCTKATPNQ